MLHTSEMTGPHGGADTPCKAQKTPRDATSTREGTVEMDLKKKETRKVKGILLIIHQATYAFK